MNDKHTKQKDKVRFNTLETGEFFMTHFMQSFIHDIYTTITNEETFPRDFLVILKRTLQNY